MELRNGLWHWCIFLRTNLVVLRFCDFFMSHFNTIDFSSLLANLFLQMAVNCWRANYNIYCNTYKLSYDPAELRVHCLFLFKCISFCHRYWFFPFLKIFFARHGEVWVITPSGLTLRNTMCWKYPRKISNFQFILIKKWFWKKGHVRSKIKFIVAE